MQAQAWLVGGPEGSLVCSAAQLLVWAVWHHGWQAVNPVAVLLASDPQPQATEGLEALQGSQLEACLIASWGCAGLQHTADYA